MQTTARSEDHRPTAGGARVVDLRVVAPSLLLGLGLFLLLIL